MIDKAINRKVSKIELSKLFLNRLPQLVIFSNVLAEQYWPVCCEYYNTIRAFIIIYLFIIDSTCLSSLNCVGQN